jgi:hypothetical protein
MLLTPVLEISPKIHKRSDGRYEIKVYNSGLLPIFEMRTFLTKVTPIKSDGGKMNVTIDTVPVSFQYLEYVPSMLKRNVRKDGGTFAVIFNVLKNKDTGLLEDIENVLSDQSDLSYYRLTISCVSGISGLKKIKTENYTYKNSIIKGEFKSGATFKKV